VANRQPDEQEQQQPQQQQHQINNCQHHGEITQKPGENPPKKPVGWFFIWKMSVLRNLPRSGDICCKLGTSKRATTFSKAI